MKHAFSCAVGTLLAVGVAGLGGCVGSNQIPQINESATGFSVYVADQGTDDVAVIDGLSGTLKTKISVGHAPSALAISGYTGAADRQLWVANSGSDSVSVIDPTSNAVVKTIPVGHKPIAMTYRVDGHDRPLMWVVNAGDQSMTAIDTSTKSVVGTFHAGTNPIGITSLTARNINAFDVTVLDGGDGTLKFYNSTTGSLEQTLQVGFNAIHAVGLDSTYRVVTASGTVESIGPTNGSADPNAAADPYLIATSSTVAGTFATGTHVLFEGTTQQPVVDLYVLSHTDAHVTFFPIGPGAQQTLPSGTSPQGAALAYLDGANGKKDQTFIYVANRDSDNISVYDGTPVTIGNEIGETFSAGGTFTLAAGSHPVAIAVFGDTPPSTPPSTPSPSPSASASASASASPSAAPTPTLAPTATASPTPAPSVSHLYVVNGNAGSIAAYALPLGAGSTPTITVNDANALGIAANASYVAVGHPGGSIDIFAQPLTATKAASFAVTAGVCDLAFDANGNLWAADGNVVEEFSPPFSNATVAAGSATAGINGAYAVTFDASNTMYVANSGNATVAALAPPYTADTAIVHAPAGARLQGIAVHGSSLYVADPSSGVIYQYALPLQSNTGPIGALSLNGPAGIAFDASGNLYATEPSYGAIGIFTAPVTGSTIPTTFTNGLSTPLGIAVSP